MIPINNSLVKLLPCQQQTENYMTHTLPAIQQLQRDHANDSLIDDIQTLNGKPGLYVDWNLKFENAMAVTKETLRS